MIYDIHTHHFPSENGTAIVQLTPHILTPSKENYHSVGLHPWDIKEDWKTQMAKVAVAALHPLVLMLGEAGLDKKNANASIETQIEVFREHITLSELLHKPLIIHCVKSIDEVLSIRKETKTTRPWIIHGFRGGVKQWEQLTRAGLYVSIGKHYDAELIRHLSPQHLLLESDDSTELDAVYKSISDDTGLSVPELRDQVMRNILRLLGHEA